ncbi:hypothetical protein SAMN05421823_102551 [Catalinimonas alkaloidigena]|uniref:HTH cro/C1-type domain-containing protein n=1 Tax=Catalinimonas alkaloidigena TaxID=1075417 RepID=A0A1G9BA87_9BACT|nr:helix-turn-helix domain-containing protein [Catalinimonas alkaloidigena]SDK35974.1 hypothetical protein SAMN05421823_102551 [Catalinimonas alkaloidigena]
MATTISKAAKIRNRIQEVIESKAKPPFVYRPTHAWFEKIGVGKQKFGRMLRNEEQPDLVQLELIARELGCSIDDLIVKPKRSSDSQPELFQ